MKVAKCIGAQEIGTDHDLMIATNYGDQSVRSPLKVSIKSVEDKSFSNACPVTGCTTDYGDPSNYRFSKNFYILSVAENQVFVQVKLLLTIFCIGANGTKESLVCPSMCASGRDSGIPNHFFFNDTERGKFFQKSLEITVQHELKQILCN